MTITPRARLLVALVLALLAPARLRAQIAVIVHPGSPVTNVSTEELRRIFLGSTSYLGSRDRIRLVEVPTLRGRFYEQLLDMSADAVKRHWLQMVFSGESAMPPVERPDDAEAKKYVASHPGAVAFVSAASVDASVRALSVDGLSYTHPNYRIR